MGRAPCCDKANVKKGPWSPEEDAKLKAYIEKHGTGGNWIALPQKIGLKRCGKSCRLRWLNYLRPNIKHGGFSEEEDNIICSLYISIGSRWSIIAAQLPGRTDNDIKNYWNTRLKKKLLGKQRKETVHQSRTRRITNNKQNQEMMKNDRNDLQNPYFPAVLPPQPPPPVPIIPYSINHHHHYHHYHHHQEEEEGYYTPLNDHTSIRKLLIKLGGKFSSDDHFGNNLPPSPQVATSSLVQPLYQFQQLNDPPAPEDVLLNPYNALATVDHRDMSMSMSMSISTAQRGDDFANTELIEQMIYSYTNNNNNNGYNWGELMSSCCSLILPSTITTTSSVATNNYEGGQLQCASSGNVPNHDHNHLMRYIPSLGHDEQC